MRFRKQAESWRGVIEQIKRTGTRKGRVQSGYFSVEGTRLCQRALKAGLHISDVVIGQKTWLTPSKQERQLIGKLQGADGGLHVVPDDTIDGLTGGRQLGQFIGLIQIPHQKTLAQVLQYQQNPLLIGLVDVVDPGNVGAIIRSAHGSGVTAVITIGESQAFHPRAVRTAMGSLFKLPTIAYATTRDFLIDLHPTEIQTIAAVSADGIPLPQYQFSDSGTAILLGNEAVGLSEAIIRSVDTPITIPIEDGIDSYSVGAAAAMILYEARRQRIVQSLGS